MSDTQLEQLKAAISSRGWRWRPGKPIPYGEQLVVSDGSAEATLDFYPKRGRTVVGGAPGPLRQALTQLTATPAEQPEPTIPLPHIGMDESGKGDWFGPLVVAAVYLQPAQAAALRRAGVRDSKEIVPEDLAKVAGAIESAVPPQGRHILVLQPADYNRRYAELKNINLLLADLYAEAAAPVIAAAGTDAVVCDQFAQRADRLDRAFAAARLPRPTQLHHAESASLAVAAASVLATARFGAELAQLGQLAGLPGPLPRGATAVRDLARAARHILAREGHEGLARYAKLNFKPVQELLERR